MKRYLLLVATFSCMTALHAQTTKKTSAYAITGVQKGSSSWTEVRLIDVSTGDEMQSIYQSAVKIDALNARTGKPIVKPEATTASLQDVKSTPTVEVVKKEVNGTIVKIERRIGHASFVNVDMTKPFATNSAALAYDKKHERLYYTPMGINQLRYIDLKSGNIYFFENEPFGVVKSRHDVANQITRMVIASDGNGYALTNDANHLIQFTTGKKPVIKDLGALTDNAANGAFSVHNGGGFGGDIIADAQKNIYLITANRNVFKISLETMQATFTGAIQGLPKGFSTNGAVVEGDSKVIVTSSNSTAGYFRFDMNTMQAEKVSSNTAVFNASDLANGNLLFDKKKKKDKEVKQEPTQQNPVVKNEEVLGKPKPTTLLSEEVLNQGSILAFPNPVNNGGLVKLSFNDQPQGRYNIQFMDASGKVISQQQVNIYNKTQVVDYRIPQLVAAGNYLIKVINEANEIASVNKLVVQ